MYMDDGERLMNWTIAATIAMCLGFVMLFIQEWFWCTGNFLIFVVLMKQANKVRREIDWEGEIPEFVDNYYKEKQDDK